MSSTPEHQQDGSPAEQGFSKLKSGPEPEILTKFGNVKSRISWTAERQQLLREMWDRGDKPAVIAEALGCKVGTVNVARARFKLTPRRVVSGRPKEPDEPAHRIERVAFTTSRLMEFCTEKELVAQTGHQSYEWPRVIAKELTDNSINACEEAGVAPSFKVTITTGHAKSRRRAAKPTRIIFEDNGPGIPPETIAGIIDYNVRVSSREAYISPMRGRQGNALKSILPMAYVLGGEGKGETWIEAHGLKHRNLRRWQERAAASAVADALLTADRKRRRRMAINDDLGGGIAPAPTNKRQDGPFAALRAHSLYRAPRNGASRRPKGAGDETAA